MDVAVGDADILYRYHNRERSVVRGCDISVAPRCISSARAAAMPCSRRVLRSAASSRMLHLPQAVVTRRIGQRPWGDREGRRHHLRYRRIVEPCRHVDHVLHADATGRRRRLQRQPAATSTASSPARGTKAGTLAMSRSPPCLRNRRRRCEHCSSAAR